MLDGNDSPHRKTATVTGPIDVINDRSPHITATQEVSVQRVRATAVDGTLRGGQRLTEHLATEDLCAAYITAFATEYVFLDPLQLEQLQEVCEYGMHGRGRVGSSIN